MSNKTMGEIISTLRKEKGLTQREIAEQLHITDKAVSKWERDLACPDVQTLPKLAEILGISVEELIQAKPGVPSGHRGAGYLADLVCKVIPLAMGIAVTVTSILGELDLRHGMTMLGIGLAGVGICLLKDRL